MKQIKPIHERALAAILAASLSLSLVPAPALAEAVGDAPAEAQSQVQAVAEPALAVDPVEAAEAPAEADISASSSAASSPEPDQQEAPASSAEAPQAAPAEDASDDVIAPEAQANVPTNTASVPQEVTVSAADSDDATTITVTAGVTGLSEPQDGVASTETIVPLTQVSVAYDENKTAEQILEQLLEDAGCTNIEANEWGLTSVTLPSGRVLDSDFAEPYRYWSFYLNGGYASDAATNYVVKPGDVVEYRYYDGNATTVKHVVSFETGEGSTVDAQQVADGQRAEAPVNPTRDGFVFAGWFLDEACTEAYDFGSAVTANLALHAKWTQLQTASVTITGVQDPSADAPIEDKWLDGVTVEFEADGSATAWDAFKIALDRAGLSYEAIEESWGVFIKSITSPSGEVLDTSDDYSRSWGFYVNGGMASVGASSYVLQPGDSVSLVYLINFEEPAKVIDGVAFFPNATGPDWDSDWAGFGVADHVTDALVPTADAAEKWVSELKSSSDYSTYVSDPILVGDYLYIAVGNKLLKKNLVDGSTVQDEAGEAQEGQLVDKIDSVSRMVYVDGLIIVPLGGGRLQALTADTLTPVWVTDALPAGTSGKQQSLTTLTVRDGYVYYGTASADWSGTTGGYFACVRVSDGAQMWCEESETGKGYYWSGMAFTGGYGVVADDSGLVRVVDPASGQTVASAQLDAAVRSTAVADGSNVYVVSNDGVLHRFAVAADGSLEETGRVSFGHSSTATPVLANGKIIVGGTSDEYFAGRWGNYYYGQLAVIDAQTLEVEYAINKADGNYIRHYGFDAGGDVKATPVVSVQDGQTYVYFTANCNPGGIYRYRVGDAEAELLYIPATENQNFCMASITVGSDGSLYYVNDSGKLFAIQGNGERTVRYNVRFDANGSDTDVPEYQKVKKGTAASEPTQPMREGYTFLGWYTADGVKWDFSAPVTGDMTLTAKWEKVETSAQNPEPGHTTDNEKGDNNKTNDDDTNINLTGNDKRNTTHTSLNGALKSNGAAAAEGDADGQTLSLLAGIESGKATGEVAGDAATLDTGAPVTTSAEAAQPSAGMPIWPFIGIGAGLAVLIVVFATRKKKGGER